MDAQVRLALADLLDENRHAIVVVDTRKQALEIGGAFGKRAMSLMGLSAPEASTVIERFDAQEAALLVVSRETCTGYRVKVLDAVVSFGVDLTHSERAQFLHRGGFESLPTFVYFWKELV